jgi:hypothetical protein
LNIEEGRKQGASDCYLIILSRWRRLIRRHFRILRLWLLIGRLIEL